MKKEEIILNPVEVTAYWWLRCIKNKIRELVVEKPRSKDEKSFLKIFYNFSDVEWRKLYLKLINYIKEDIDNYELKGIFGLDCFNQDTDRCGHDRLNYELSRIIDKSIPDIRLASNNRKDFVIYTDLTGAYEWYKSCGTRKLDDKYDANYNYILTGNETELDFYNLILATIIKLDSLDKSFDSISILRERFCREYQLLNNIDNLERIYDEFNCVFNKLNDKDIVLGRFWKETYFPTLREIDYNGLEEYMIPAKHYANVVLNILSKDENPKVKSKTL